MNLIWIALGVISIILLLVYFRTRNAVWGGFTIGIIVGLVVAIIGAGFSWSTIAKGAIIGILIGFGAELLGMLGNLFRKS